MQNVIDVLKERGFIEAVTSEEVRLAASEPIKVYCGFDPTSDALHLGNLVPLMGLAWFQRYGHTPVALMGGATGMIGDPSGKAHERQLLDEETIQSNLIGIRKNLEQVLLQQGHLTPPLIVNNLDWYRKFSLIPFLRDIGKLFRLGPMLGRESVKLRLESEEGMSFTEFTYQILQGYDFLYLFENYGVSIELGGSDQWGNILAGTDLIRKTHGKVAHGVTFPLLTRSDGQKFGKSEQGAIWLSPEKLSPYAFYQYLIRVPDADVIKLMKMLTFMEIEEIKKVENSMTKEDYLPRTAQKKLAEEVTQLIHGPEGVVQALKVTDGIAPGGVASLDPEMLESLGQEVPNCEIPLEQVLYQKVVDLLVLCGLQPSKGEARRLIRNGGVYINNQKIEEEQACVDASHLIDNRLMLVAAGKKNKMLLRIKN